MLSLILFYNLFYKNKSEQTIFYTYCMFFTVWWVSFIVCDRYPYLVLSVDIWYDGICILN